MGTMVKLEPVLVTFLNILTLVSTKICQGPFGKFCCIGYKMDAVERICIPCELGYTGVNCELKCPFPSYGLRCQMWCTCKEEYCDFVNGCKLSLYDIAFKFPNIVASSKSHNDKNVDIITESFNSNDGGFNTTLGRDGDIANYKKDKSPPAKRNTSSSLMHASIGLAIVAFLIVIIYLYTYQRENCQLPCSKVYIFLN